MVSHTHNPWGSGSDPLTYSLGLPRVILPWIKVLENSSLKQWSSRETSWKLEWGKIVTLRSQHPSPVLWLCLRFRFIPPEWLGNPHGEIHGKVRSIKTSRTLAEEAPWTLSEPPAYKSHIASCPLPHLIPVPVLKPSVTGIDCFQEHMKQTTPTRGSHVQKVQTTYKETMIR